MTSPFPCFDTGGVGVEKISVGGCKAESEPKHLINLIEPAGKSGASLLAIAIRGVRWTKPRGGRVCVNNAGGVFDGNEKRLACGFEFGKAT